MSVLSCGSVIKRARYHWPALLLCSSGTVCCIYYKSDGLTCSRLLGRLSLTTSVEEKLSFLEGQRTRGGVGMLICNSNSAQKQQTVCSPVRDVFSLVGAHSSASHAAAAPSLRCPAPTQALICRDGHDDDILIGQGVKRGIPSCSPREHGYAWRTCIRGAILEEVRRIKVL
jgi:hypothetical protein